MWLLWTLIAVFFIIGELHTNAFYLAPFALGAVVALIVVAVGVGGLVPALAFAGTGTLCLVGLRPVAMRHMNHGPRLRTGAAALIGKRATVLTEIAEDGQGTVKIGGEVWTARAYDNEQAFSAGESADVVEIEGATALIMR
jgi:membrane protein implicated in regulation of membrane protease activity